MDDFSHRPSSEKEDGVSASGTSRRESPYNTDDYVDEPQRRHTLQRSYERERRSGDKTQGFHKKEVGLQPGICNSAVANQPMRKSTSNFEIGEIADFDGAQPQKVNRGKQLLFLFHHASTCTSQRCRVARNCEETKRLRDHIQRCTNGNTCRVPQCMAMRKTIHHYRDCRRNDCLVCGPVRKATQTHTSTGECVDTIQILIEDMHSAHKDKLFTQNFDPWNSPAGISTKASNQCSDRRDGPGSKRRRTDIDRHRGDCKDRDTDVASMSGSAFHCDFADRDLPSYAGESDEMVAVSELNDKRRKTEQCSVEVSEEPSVLSATRSMSSCWTSDEPQESAAIRSLTRMPIGKSPRRSFLHSLSVGDLEHHIASLKVEQVPTTLSNVEKSRCSRFLNGLENHDQGWLFESPVDTEQFPDYLDIIENPMDFATLRQNLEKDRYCSVEQVRIGAMLIFDNAIKYFSDERDTGVKCMAEALKEKAIADYAKLQAELPEIIEKTPAQSEERTCALCGDGVLHFRPPTLFCCEEKCRRKISRNVFYYVAPKSQNHVCCSACYDASDGSVVLDSDDGRRVRTMKEQMKKSKNDEKHEENWVQCSSCECWTHHVCGLFNPQHHMSSGEKYSCPVCVLNTKRNIVSNQMTGGGALSASDLPLTELSQHMEKQVRELVVRRTEELIQEKATKEGVSLDDARQFVEVGGPIIVRQLAASYQTHSVNALMRERYARQNYPSEFRYQSKCFVVFQSIHGVDIALFAFCVFEHGEDNPSPNKGVVNISLLDSVHFMKPQDLRTEVYHEILICYLENARNRGFSKAYIWSCPPTLGRDYVFHGKPDDQKQPSPERLRKWYLEILAECKRRGIVSRVTTMFSLHFASGTDTASKVPYLAGDYFSTEMDRLLTDMEQEGREMSLQEGAGDELMETLRKKMKIITKNKNHIVAFLDQSRRESCAEIDDNEFEIFQPAAFLDLCIQNHYQFGDFRLAKYSSMMLLWHLHNQPLTAFSNGDE